MKLYIVVVQPKALSIWLARFMSLRILFIVWKIRYTDVKIHMQCIAMVSSNE